MMDGFVRWFQWSGGRIINYGQMRRSEIAQTLREFEAEAQKILERSGADHVLYGIKWYEEDGSLSRVSLYIDPMTEEEFEKDVTRLTNVQVYAVHARK